MELGLITFSTPAPSGVWRSFASLCTLALSGILNYLIMITSSPAYLMYSSKLLCTRGKPWRLNSNFGTLEVYDAQVLCTSRGLQYIHDEVQDHEHGTIVG